MKQLHVREFQKLDVAHTHQVTKKISTSKWTGKAETHFHHKSSTHTALYNGKLLPNFQLIPDMGYKGLDRISSYPTFKAPTQRMCTQNTWLWRLTGLYIKCKGVNLSRSKYKGLNVKTWNHKTPRRKQAVRSLTSVLLMIFWMWLQKQGKKKKKKNKWDYIKPKSICAVKGPYAKWQENY